MTSQMISKVSLCRSIDSLKFSSHKADGHYTSWTNWCRYPRSSFDDYLAWQHVCARSLLPAWSATNNLITDSAVHLIRCSVTIKPTTSILDEESICPLRLLRCILTIRGRTSVHEKRNHKLFTYTHLMSESTHKYLWDERSQPQNLRNREYPLFTCNMFDVFVFAYYVSLSIALKVMFT